jgi:uncharacterized protein YbaR (Trm112 family)
MTLKKNNMVVHASAVFIEVTPRGIVHRHISQANKTIDNVPRWLLDELNAYTEQNAILTKIKDDAREIVCCPNCLKAHALTLAKKMNVDKRIKKKIETFFKCPIGHNGYYLNGNELVSL